MVHCFAALALLAGRPGGRAVARQGAWSGAKRNFRGRRRRNPLKSLKTAKGIQGNQSIFLGRIWLDFAPFWVDFAKFGPAWKIFGSSGLGQGRKHGAPADFAPANGAAVEAPD